MKRMRKMIALLLVFSSLLLSALPVSAAVGEGVAEPNVVVSRCDRCGGNIPKTPKKHYGEVYRVETDGLDSSHKHYYYYDYNEYTCSCGKKYIEIIRIDPVYHCTNYPNHCPGIR